MEPASRSVKPLQGALLLALSALSLLLPVWLAFVAASAVLLVIPIVLSAMVIRYRTVADKKGLFQAWLNPGARIPLAFERVTVWFTAGPTTYDFDVLVGNPSFTSIDHDELLPAEGGEKLAG